MINCNPETVSTDYDVADKLYFEPLTYEDVLNVIELEKPDGVIIQFGGQTPLKLALPLEKAGVTIWGTSPDSIDLAEDRDRFGALLDSLDVAHPQYATATSVEEALEVAGQIGFPMMVRPSYVLGGRAMEIVYDMASLENYMHRAVKASEEHPVLLDRFLEDAYEFDVDAISDGEHTEICGLMQHIEEAGVHSGRQHGRAAALPAQPRAARRHRRDDPHDRREAEGQGHHQHPVRDPLRHPLHPRGEPARLAHGAVRQQGDRDPGRQAGGPGHDRPEARRPRGALRDRPALRGGQGVGHSRSTGSTGRTSSCGPRCAPPARSWASRPPSATRS